MNVFGSGTSSSEQWKQARINELNVLISGWR